MDGVIEESERLGCTVRALRASDLSRLVRMDEQHSGRTRRAFLEQRLSRALAADVNVSLGAEIDGGLVGALMASVSYGEFGQAEPIAVLDTILVDPGFTRRGVAGVMLAQLLENLRGLRIERLRTEVAWNEHDLVGFLAREGFSPAPRIVLERAV